MVRLALAKERSVDVDDIVGVFRSVTILATPAEAEAIELAATSGRPRLVLRSGNDRSQAQTQGVTVSDLRGQSVPKIDPRVFAVTAPVISPTTAPVAVRATSPTPS